MHVMTRTYHGIDGKERTEDFHFHFKESDLVKLELSTPEGLTTKLQSLQNSNDSASAWAIICSIVDAAYGAPTPDGRGFVKSPAALQNFQGTEVYSDIIIEFIADPMKFIDFLSGAFPRSLQEAVKTSASEAMIAYNKAIGEEESGETEELPEDGSIKA